jgi:hypothetical protein
VTTPDDTDHLSKNAANFHRCLALNTFAVIYCYIVLALSFTFLGSENLGSYLLKIFVYDTTRL